MSRNEVLPLLLGKIPKQAFEAKYWNRQPYLYSVPAGELAPFDLKTFLRLLAHRNVRPSDIRIACDGLKPPGNTVRNVGELVQENGFRIRSYLDDGYSVVLRHVSRFSPKVSEYCYSLATALGARVSANVILSPPGGAAFPQHSDPDASIIVQTQGTKMFNVIDPNSSEPECADNAISFRLAPGDCLYFPAKWQHHAVAENDLSVTLAFSVLPWTRADLMQVLLEAYRDAAVPGQTDDVGIELFGDTNKSIATIRDALETEVSTLSGFATDHAEEIYARIIARTLNIEDLIADDQ
jgi:ribosomal protein L16 Arg81 hydroxylase